MAAKLALLSVSDKTDLINLAKGLIGSNFKLVASGGTSKLIKDNKRERHEIVNKISTLAVSLCFVQLLRIINESLCSVIHPIMREF